MSDRKFIQDGLSNQGEAEFEHLLEQFSPRASNVNSARVMFLAGRESAAAIDRQRSSSAWPLATAAMAVVAITCAVLLAARVSQGPEVVQRIVWVRDASGPAVDNSQPGERAAEAVDQSITPGSESKPRRSRESGLAFSPRHSTYFAARRTVLTAGIDAMPIAPVSRHATYQQIPSLGSYRNDMLSRLGAGGGSDGSGELPREPTDNSAPKQNGDNL